YSGHKSSRAELFDSHETKITSGWGEISDRSSESDAENTDSEIDQSMSESNNSNSDSESESQSQLSHNDADVTAERSQIKALLEAQRKSVASKMSDSAKADAEKGRAVKSQMSSFEKILDARIHIQKALTLSNMVPVGDSISEAEIAEPKQKLLSLACHIAEIRHSLLRNIDSEIQPLSSKRTYNSIDDALSDSKAIDSSLSLITTEVLNRWSKRIQDFSGASTLSSSKFKAINQPVSAQVANVLSDMDRLIKRARTNRSGLKIDGKDPQIVFDDTDFYKSLLRAFVDSKSSESVPTAVQWINEKQNKPKDRQKVKHSKGRVLDYKTQDALANFDAPRHNPKEWSNERITDFLAGILGQRRDLIDEKVASASDVAESIPEEEINDDLRIFG
ncbi:hypothetical protein CANCADRAFT_12455, partial [Tortispora caseinolytica NRRL Y-17796]